MGGKPASDPVPTALRWLEGGVDGGVVWSMTLD